MQNYPEIFYYECFANQLQQIHGYRLCPGYLNNEHDAHGWARLCLLHPQWVCNPRLWLHHGGGAEVWAQALWLLRPACCQNRKILRLLGPGLIFSMFNYAEDPYIWLVGPWQLHNPDGVRPSFQMQNEGWYPLHWTRGFTGAGCQEALHAFKQHYHWHLCEFYWRRWSMVLRSFLWCSYSTLSNTAQILTPGRGEENPSIETTNFVERWEIRKYIWR